MVISYVLFIFLLKLLNIAVFHTGKSNEGAKKEARKAKTERGRAGTRGPHEKQFTP